MLESYVQVKSEVEAMLWENREFEKLVNIDIGIVNEMIEFLKPIRKCSRSLSGDKYPTIHLVPYMYAWLKLEIGIKKSDSHEMKSLQRQAEVCFHEYLTLDPFYYMACILNPKYCFRFDY